MSKFPVDCRAQVGSSPAVLLWAQGQRGGGACPEIVAHGAPGPTGWGPGGVSLHNHGPPGHTRCSDCFRQTQRRQPTSSLWLWQEQAMSRKHKSTEPASPTPARTAF